MIVAIQGLPCSFHPIIGQPLNYKFFIVVDCAGELLYKLVEQIEKSDHQVTLLGEYIAA